MVAVRYITLTMGELMLAHVMVMKGKKTIPWMCPDRLTLLRLESKIIAARRNGGRSASPFTTAERRLMRKLNTDYAFELATRFEHILHGSILQSDILECYEVANSIRKQFSNFN